MHRHELAPDLTGAEHRDVQPEFRSLVRLRLRRWAASTAVLPFSESARRDRRSCSSSTRRIAGLFRSSGGRHLRSNESESPPPSAWSRSRKISQSSRAWPGGRVARLSRCSRPLPLIIEPRFSAKPNEGSTTVAFFVASFGKVFMTTKAGICASSSTDKPRCIGFSFKITNALIPPDLTALAMITSFAPGAELEPRINRAPFVFGLRSSLSKMSSACPRLGTISISFTPNEFANCAVNQSSSFVIRPEARKAISDPAKCFNWSAACPIAVGHSAATSLPSERICGSSKRSFGFEIFVIEPAVVAHPGGVDGIVLARCLAINDVLAGADDRVAAGRATGADALRFLQKPDAHLEAEIRRSQRADRADVDGVERVIVVERLARMRGERCV